MRWQGAGTQGTGGSDGQTDYGIDPVNRTSAAGQGDSAIPGLLAQLLNRSGRWKIEDGRSKIGGLYLLTPISHLRCYLLTPIFDLLSANYHLLCFESPSTNPASALRKSTRSLIRSKAAGSRPGRRRNNSSVSSPITSNTGTPSRSIHARPHCTSRWKPSALKPVKVSSSRR